MAQDNDTPCILVADDEDYITDLLSVVLEGEGYTTYKAYDGREALAVIEHYPVDMVITDIMMPHIDGNYVVQKLLEKDQTQKIPILMISAGAYPGNLPSNIKFVPKPFEIQAILDIVRSTSFPHHRITH